MSYKEIVPEIKKELEGKGELVGKELQFTLPESVVEKNVLEPNKIDLDQLKGIHSSIGNIIEASQQAVGELVIENGEAESGRLKATIGGDSADTLFTVDRKKKDVSVYTTYVTSGTANLEAIQANLKEQAAKLFE